MQAAVPERVNFSPASVLGCGRAVRSLCGLGKQGLNGAMELPPELKSPLLPELSLEHVAEHERDCGHAFFEHMRMLQRWSFDFSSSASLFDFAVKPPSTDVRGQWCFIAARNGGLALRNYARSLESARELLPQVTCWEEKFDNRDLDAVHHQFRNRFPGVEKLLHRHGSIGPHHEVDNHAAVASLTKKHDCLFGHTYMSTVEGQTVSFDLTFQNAQFLTDLTKSAYSSLEPIYAR